MGHNIDRDRGGEKERRGGEGGEEEKAINGYATSNE